MPEKITLHKDDLLLIIDVQNDFVPEGALPVPEGDKIIAPINGLSQRFSHTILSQDWHPHDHSSFASSHKNKQPFDNIHMPYGAQTLWPDHCIEASYGADFHPKLDTTKAQLIVRKGFRSDVDSYSAFYENDRKTSTGLAGYLKERKIRRIFMVGLVYEFCVGYSALDGRHEGFEVFVIHDCTGTFGGEGEQAMSNELKASGVHIIQMSDLI